MCPGSILDLHWLKSLTLSDSFLADHLTELHTLYLQAQAHQTELERVAAAEREARRIAEIEQQRAISEVSLCFPSLPLSLDLDVTPAMHLISEHSQIFQVRESEAARMRALHDADTERMVLETRMSHDLERERRAANSTLHEQQNVIDKEKMARMNAEAAARQAEANT